MDTTVDNYTALNNQNALTLASKKRKKSSNRRNWKVILCKRDQLILRDLFFSKGLSLEFLVNRHFEDRHKTTAIKRLHRLYDGKFLTKKGFFENSRLKIIYSITPKGLEIIKDELSGPLIRNELESSNHEHDLPLAQIFDRLLAAKNLIELKTENEIQSINFGDEDSIYRPFRRLNTDIYFSCLLKEKEYQIAIEFERTKKKLSRWIKYLLNYHLEDSIDIVFYICHDKHILKGLRKIETDLAKKFSGKIFFCTTDDFFSKKEIAIFTNTNGKTITLHFQSTATSGEL